MNLFDTLNEALTDEVVSKIAKLSEEEPEKTRKALDGVFYTLIAGLVRRTGSMMSVSMLFNQIQKGNQGGELIGDVMSYLNKKDKLDNLEHGKKDKVAILISRMDSYINIYKQILPILLNEEKKYVALSKKINDITNTIKTIFHI